MKKLLTKIAGVSVGIAMAVGVCVGAVIGVPKSNPTYAATTSINFIKSGYSYNDTVATLSGSASSKSGNSYWGMYGGASLTTNETYHINSTASVAIAMSARTYGSMSAEQKTMTFNILNSAGTSILATGALSPSNNSVNPYSGTISAFGSNDNLEVKFQLVSNASTTDAVFVGLTSATVEYTNGGDIPVASTFTVGYDANGGTGTMSDSNSPYNPNATVTTLSNTFTRANYTFDHWNTEPDGSGANYDVGDSFTITESVILYAQWEVVKYTDANNKITWPLSVPSYDSMSETSASWSSPKASIVVTKADAGTAVNNYCPPEQSSTRFYNKNSMTISPASGYRIESIIFTATSNGYATTLQSGAWTNATAVASSSTVTVTPTTKTNDVSVTFSGTSGINKIVVDYSPNLSSIAISGTYPTEFTEGDLFSHSGMVVTATYTDSSNANVTSSASWSGYNMSSPGNQTVTVSYSEEGITRTATYGISISEAVNPFITPTKNSTTGYTDQNEVISFTYGNLTNDPSVASDNTEVVTISNLSFENNAGSVRLNFVGNGTTNVKFYDGEDVLSTLSVEVSLSSVTIDNLPSSKSMCIGETLDLGSLIEITSVGSCSSDVTWSSSNETVATVDENGLVTAAAKGSTNITVTPDDYSSGVETCTVTVSKSSFKLANNLQDGKKYIIAAQGSTPGDLYYLPAANTTITKNPDAVKIATFATLTETNAWTASIDASSHITFSNQVEETTYYLVAKDDSQGIGVATSSSGYWTLDATGLKYSEGGPRYLALYNDSSFRNYTSGQNMANVFYEFVPAAKDVVSEIDTLSSLSYSDYTKVAEDNYTFTDLLIRYGGFISQDLWERLDDELDIQGYGVILSTGNEEIEDLYAAAKDEGDTVIEALAEFVDGTNIKRFYTALSLSKTHPTEATTSQKELMGVDTGDTYYIWTLGKGISSEHMTTVFNVVAYIIVDDDIVFLDAAKESTKTLASALIAAGAYEEDAFGGSLKYLADLSVLP